MNLVDGLAGREALVFGVSGALGAGAAAAFAAAGARVTGADRAALAAHADGSGFAYSVSKLGVLHLVSMAAHELHGTGVTVNALMPSIIDTPANPAAMPNSDHAAWPKVPDVAGSYLYLASPAAELVNGATLPV